MKKSANESSRGRVCYSSKRYDDFTLTKCTVGVSTSFYAIFDSEDIYGHYCIQKRNNDHFLSLFTIILLKVKRSSFPVF